MGAATRQEQSSHQQTTTTILLLPLSLSLSLLLSSSSSSFTVQALSFLEPPDGKIMIGGWLDTTDPTSSSSSSSSSAQQQDSSYAFDQRLNIRASLFSLSQNIPASLAPSPPYPANTYLYADVAGLNDDTDAVVQLTVYPKSGLDSVKQHDLDNLATQLVSITQQTGRNILLRYAPEMNGNWFAYGRKPKEFVDQWVQMAQTVRNASKNVALLWAPNMGVNESDYVPYWPGSDYVDWVGMSIYWKGYHVDYPWISNKLPPDNYVASIIAGLGGTEGANFDFYSYFCKGFNKPFALAETGAAFHVSYIDTTTSTTTTTPIDPGPGKPLMTSTFFSTFLFNKTFLQTYPLVKLINLFEFTKNETEGKYIVQRDFKSSFDPGFQGSLKRLTDDGGVAMANPGADAGVPVTGAVSVFTTRTGNGTSRAGGGVRRMWQEGSGGREVVWFVSLIMMLYMF